MNPDQARNLSDRELETAITMALLSIEIPVERRLSAGDRAAMLRWFGNDRRASHELAKC